MKRIVVILYGPPGSGKTIQADLLARAFNLIHFDVGQFLEGILYDPANRRNRFIQSQRKIFEEGGLCDPAWVGRLVGAHIKTIARAGFGAVLSGSLRTLEETFGGTRGGRGLLNILEKTYGRQHIVFFELAVPLEASLRRNRIRLVCTICGRPALTQIVKGKYCPVCGGKLARRTLDASKIIKERFREYRHMTEPVYAELKRHRYTIHRVDGTPLPFITHRRIRALIERWHS